MGKHSVNRCVSGKILNLCDYAHFGNVFTKFKGKMTNFLALVTFPSLQNNLKNCS